MKYLLDTNICIYLINRKQEALIEIIEKEKTTDVAISFVTIAELHYGVYKSEHQERNLSSLQKFLTPFQIISFSSDMATLFGKHRATLAKKGKLIGPYDMLIATQALYHDLTLVTNNVKEFNRIPELKIENWLK
ncbi:MAG: type II toxin-antitoxin system VapC family toxin [Chitinophagales bacterium]|nr:type II toxin-antitoxin system VapC family toxin [Chitinophagales bacterium]